MSLLTFAATDVDRLIRHAQSCTEFIHHTDTPVERPLLLLAADNGVYLMSNGTPGDMVAQDPNPQRFVAYAKGINPTTDADWWEAKQQSYGGDDGVDALDMIAQMNALIARGDAEIHLALSETTIRLIDLQPGALCKTPSSLGGTFRVKLLSIANGFATVRNHGNAGDFDDAQPYSVRLDQLWRLDALAARRCAEGAI